LAKGKRRDGNISHSVLTASSIKLGKGRGEKRKGGKQLRIPPTMQRSMGEKKKVKKKRGGEKKKIVIHSTFCRDY